MKNPETNKGTMKMTTKKWLTVMTTLLLTVLPLQGLSAANATTVDTSLAVFQVDGNDVEDGDIVVVAGGTTSVTVVATPTDSNASVSVSGDTGLVTGDNDLVVTVTGSDNTTTETYTVNVFVTSVGPGFSNDTTLSDVKINGTSLSPGQMIEVAPLTSAVTVEVTTGDINATSVVSGAINLVTGNNTVTVTVTAEDGTTTKAYTFKVKVLPLSSDVALDTFTVNGQAVRSGGRIYLSPNTESVTVVATTSDPASSVQVTGATGLSNGSNTLSVVVTAPSGATATYTVTLNVELPSNISTLSVFKVAGARTTADSTVILPAGTNAVAVVAVPSDASANVAITGSADLQIGDNALSVTVTAEDGSTTVYNVTLRVLKDDDTSLSVFQVGGEDVNDGDSFELEYGTTSVEVTATPTTELSSVEIIGANTLVTGKNTVRVVVTAQDESVKTYRLFFTVAANTDTTLASVTVNGQDASGGSVTVPAGTRAVTVAPVTTDPFATFTVSGNSDLVTGENEVTITVTAADGSTSEEVTITVTVEAVVLSDDVSLESVTVAGLDASGGSVTVPAGTRAVVVSAVTTDPFASYVVEGNTDLEPGDNEVVITVTAADGETTGEVTITVTVEAVVLSDDVSLESVTVAGLDASGGSVTVPAGTRAVVVSAVTTDPFASYVVEGNTDLEPGDNEVVITVTAADGETTGQVTINVVVSAVVLNTNTAVSSITVAGIDATGLSVDVGFGTRAVLVTVITADPFATYTVADNTDLQPGENTVTVTVTAQDGETTQDYEITVNVPVLSDDTSTSLFQVNGIDVEDGGQVTLPHGTRKVNVKVELTDVGATFMIEGNGRLTPLVEGDQDLVLTVIAANGDVATYTVTLTVSAISQNADLAEEDPVLVNGEAVDTELLNNATGYLNLPRTTTRVAIAAVAADSMSDVFINDKTVLPGRARLFSVETGVNTFTIEVIPEAGEDFAKQYVLKIYVGGADASLKLAKVGNTTVNFVDGQATLGTALANGTTSTTLYVEPNMPLKAGSSLGTIVAISGDGITATQGAGFTWNVTGLVTFENSITILVTPGDSSLDPVEYTLTINVAPSSDKTLKGNAFKVNGVSYPVGSTQIFTNLFDAGETFVEIDAETTNPDATFEVSGGDELVGGTNELVVTVTAQDEVSVGVYKIFAILPKGKDVLTIPFAKAGLITIDKKSNAPADKILVAEVGKLTKAKSSLAVVNIANDFLVAKDKPTAGPARAAAIQKFFQAQKVTGAKTAKYVLAKGPTKPKGTTVTIYWY